MPNMPIFIIAARLLFRCDQQQHHFKGNDIMVKVMILWQLKSLFSASLPLFYIYYANIHPHRRELGLYLYDYLVLSYA